MLLSRAGPGAKTAFSVRSSRGLQFMSGCVLQRPTLILNRHWQPVRVAPVARALIMLWNQAACVIDPDDFQLYSWSDWAKLAPKDGEPFIRTVRFHLRVPEVLALTRHDRARHQTVTFSRRNLFKRDHSTCQYCGCQPGTEELTIDHVIPRAQGGQTTWENCVLACVACNARKANRTPEQAGMKLRRLPLRPSWKPLYDATGIRIASWSRFLSDAYWNVPLDPSR
jgi:5-methylcytosine-specific restriction endonuclease McrA